MCARLGSRESLAGPESEGVRVNGEKGECASRVGDKAVTAACALRSAGRHGDVEGFERGGGRAIVSGGGAPDTGGCRRRDRLPQLPRMGRHRSGHRVQEVARLRSGLLLEVARHGPRASGERECAGGP